MKKTLILTVAFLLVFGYLFMLHSAQETPTEETPKEKWQATEIALGKAVTAMEILNGDLKKHRKEFSELKRNALVSLLVAFTPVDALKTLFTGTGTPERAWELKVLMINIFVQQEVLNGDLANLASARDTAYEAYKETTSQPDSKEFTPNYANIPLIYLPCLGGCGHTYSSKVDGMGNLAWLALQGHAVYCSYEPHKRNKNWYWGCQYTSCPVPDQHDHLCIGNCGNIGTAQWAVVDKEGKIYSLTLSNKNRTAVNDELVTIASHKKACPAQVRERNQFWFQNLTTDCPYYYYQCNSSNTCPNKDNHVSGDGTPPSSGTPPPTPTYHACGLHETTVSGDHSLQASCSLTDENGQSCTVTGFYACQSHTCVFPDPPAPTLVECAHSNCSEMVSSRTSHRTQCGSGQHYYWPGCPNNTNWWSQDSTHALKTCRYGTCGQTWRRCLTPTPNCSSPNRQGKKCWAADP